MAGEPGVVRPPAERAALTVLSEPGSEALHRITSVLAHQRVRVRTLALGPASVLPDLAELTIEVDATGAALEQLVKRLRRSLPVRRVTVVG